MENNNCCHNKSFIQRAEMLKTEMLKLGYTQINSERGCSEQEIRKLQQKYEVVFPDSYIIYLKNFGHSFGCNLMGEVDVSYDKVFDLTRFWKDEILIEDDAPTLPEKAFIIASRYGEQCMFFDANGLLEEPPIFYYMDGDEGFIKVYDSIFDLLEETFESLQKLNKKRKQSH